MQKLALPIMIADTSAMRDLMDIEAAGDELSSARHGGHFRASEVIDELCVKGNRTLMMPGSVLTELFPTLSGRLTLAEDEQGKATFPLGIGHQMFPKSDQNALYQYLSQLAQEGKLRCYDSPEEMMAAHEVTQPRGGVVFVSMGERRDPSGHAFSEHKNDRAMTPPDKEPPQHGVNAFKDEGDRDVCNLLKHIDHHARQFGVDPRVMFFNTDGGIYRRLHGRPENIAAEYMKPMPLMNSMVALGLLDQSTTPAFNNAIEHLAETDAFWQRYISRLESKDGMNHLLKDTKKAIDWIEATKRPDTSSARSK